MAYGSSSPVWLTTRTVNYNVPNAQLGLPTPAATSLTGAGTPVTGTTQKSTIANNAAVMPDIEALAKMINGIQQAAQVTANQGRIPQGKVLEEQSSQNIGSYLKGEVPADVLYQIGQQAATRGVATGNPYGANSNAAYLRALGLTSVDLMNKGQEQLTAAVGRNPAAPLWDPSTMFLTPAEAEKIRLQEAQLNLEQQRLELQRYLGELEAQSRQNIANTAASRPYNYGGYSPGMQPATTGGNNFNWADLFGGTPTTSGGTALPGTTSTDSYDMDTLLYGTDPTGYWGGDLTTPEEQALADYNPDEEFWNWMGEG